MDSRERTPVAELYGAAQRGHVPLNMLLELTYRCNERCLHCYLPETQDGGPPAGDELSAAQWGRVLEELAEAGTLYLILSGGEVLLRADLEEILRRARELRFAVEIFTNAVLLTPEIADAWASLDIAGVGVSCYGPDAVLHDRVTRLPGSFDRTLNGVRLLRRRGIAVNLKCPLMRLNWRGYEGLLALARELGAGCQFDPLLVPRNDGSDVPPRMGLGDAQLRRVYRDARLAPPGDVGLARPLPPEEPPCSAGRTSGAIGPYGDVTPCIQWMVPAGNVREAPFRDIWRSGAILLKARGYAAKDIRACPDCGGPHYVHCPGLSQLQRGDPLAPSSDSCRLTRTLREIQNAK